MFSHQSIVAQDDVTDEISKLFDYEFDGVIDTDVKIPNLPSSFSIGLIVGASGSGKTTILKTLGELASPNWDKDKAVCSQFNSSEEAKNRLSAAGLNSIPSWLKPFHVLSNGEQFRANLARSIESGALIDEFTSVVDRNVAKSCSVAVSKYIKREGLSNVVFASCHYDIIDWLQPDWVYDASLGEFLDRGSERPAIEIELLPCGVEVWSVFSPHHYLTGEINKSARCWLAIWNGEAVGFSSVVAFPNGNFDNGYREHRTVVLPDFQGMSMGSAISDATGEIMLKMGKRYFSKTANPVLGEYRNRADNWRPTSKNMRERPDYESQRGTKESKYKHKHQDRFCYSHEYIGYK